MKSQARFLRESSFGVVEEWLDPQQEAGGYSESADPRSSNSFKNSTSLCTLVDGFLDAGLYSPISTQCFSNRRACLIA